MVRLPWLKKAASTSCDVNDTMILSWGNSIKSGNLIFYYSMNIWKKLGKANATFVCIVYLSQLICDILLDIVASENSTRYRQ